MRHSMWTLQKLRKAIFCYRMINFSVKELKFSRSLYFIYTERFASAKVDKKVTLLLIYHISGFLVFLVLLEGSEDTWVVVNVGCG